MSRRPTLPGADELFRATASPASGTTVAERPGLAAVPDPPAAAALAVADQQDATPVSVLANGIRTEAGAPAPGRVKVTARRPARTRPAAERRSSGRERHDEKITVYVSPEELVDLEHARLVLRSEQGLAVDRGRIVREALAIVLADFDSKGPSSILVRRLLEG